MLDTFHMHVTSKVDVASSMITDFANKTNRNFISYFERFVIVFMHLLLLWLFTTKYAFNILENASVEPRCVQCVCR